MKQITNRFIAAAAGIVLVIFSGMSTLGYAADAKAPIYPTKAIDVVVPFPPGAGTDIMARVVVEALSKRWKYPVNVLNKAGGSTIIGTNEAMRASPDGYTILVDSPGSSSMQLEDKTLPYRVEQRTFIARAVASPMAFIVPSTSPWKTLKDVVDAAKKDPGSLTWASLGGTSGTDLLLRHFFATAGIDVPKTKVVTFAGGTPALNAVAGGHVQLGVGTGGTVIPLVSSGNARNIAVTSAERLKDFPAVPTTKEQGFAGVNEMFWIGFSGPQGLPDYIVKAWGEAITAALKDPEVTAKLATITTSSAYLGPEDFRKFVFDEAKLVKELLGSKPN